MIVGGEGEGAEKGVGGNKQKVNTDSEVQDIVIIKESCKQVSCLSLPGLIACFCTCIGMSRGITVLPSW